MSPPEFDEKVREFIGGPIKDDSKKFFLNSSKFHFSKNGRVQPLIVEGLPQSNGPNPKKNSPI